MRKNTAISLSSLALVGAMLSAMLAPKFVSAQSETVIQGQTPSGGFQTVGVSSQGYLFVVTSSGVAQSVNIIGSVPYQVNLATSVPGAGATLNPVTIVGAPSFTGTFTETPSTAATISTGQFAIDTTPTIICPVNHTRFQATACNADPSNIIYVGNSGVTATTGSPIFPRTCFRPDIPASFQGALYAVSTATLAGTPASCLQITP